MRQENQPTLDEVIKQTIRERIAAFDGNFRAAARSLGITRQMIWGHGFRKRIVKIPRRSHTKRTNEVIELNGKSK